MVRTDLQKAGKTNLVGRDLYNRLEGLEGSGGGELPNLTEYAKLEDLDTATKFTAINPTLDTPAPEVLDKVVTDIENEVKTNTTAITDLTGRVTNLENSGGGGGGSYIKKETVVDLSLITQDDLDKLTLDCLKVEAGTTDLILTFSTTPKDYSAFYLNNILKTDISIIKYSPILESVDFATHPDQVRYAKIYLDCYSSFTLQAYFYKNLNVTATTPYLISMPLYEGEYAIYFDITGYKATNNPSNFIAYSFDVSVYVDKSGAIIPNQWIYLSGFPTYNSADLCCIDYDAIIKEPLIFDSIEADTPMNYKKPNNMYAGFYKGLISKVKNMKSSVFIQRTSSGITDKERIFLYDSLNNITINTNFTSPPRYTLSSNTIYSDTSYTNKRAWASVKIYYHANDDAAQKLKTE